MKGPGLPKVMLLGNNRAGHYLYLTGLMKLAYLLAIVRQTHYVSYFYFLFIKEITVEESRRLQE